MCQYTKCNSREDDTATSVCIIKAKRVHVIPLSVLFSDDCVSFHLTSIWHPPAFAKVSFVCDTNLFYAIIQSKELLTFGCCSNMSIRQAVLSKQLARYEMDQSSAQIMQYGIWKEWREEQLSQRLAAASQRWLKRAWQRLVGNGRFH